VGAFKERRTVAVALATAVVALLLGAATASARPASGPVATPSVIGGHIAEIADYPWLAYIEAELSPGSGLVFSCTGSVVAPRVVLTAGHCVEDLETEALYSASTYRVATGVASRLRPPRDHVSRVSRVLVFPGFRSAFIHGDAGLLILSKPVAAPPLPMAGVGDGALVAAEAPLEVVGWGLTNPARDDGPALLRAGDLTVQMPSRCFRGKTELHRHFSPTQQLCALDTPDFKTSGCYGDSGGPALGHRSDGSAVAVGIVSAGGSECEIREPNLFTRVDFVSQWASEWIAAVETGAPAPPIPLRPPPLMGLPEAEFLAQRGLAEAFTGGGRAQRLDFEESVHGTCKRAERSEFDCRVHWLRHANDYFGTISVFYAPHTAAFLWGDRFSIHWVSDRCRRTAKNPRSCQVSSRKLRDEKLKRLPEF
jgi:secreted trypsin-like serine protease